MKCPLETQVKILCDFLIVIIKGFFTGKFLERGKYRKTNGKFFTPFDFNIGKSVTITGRSFYLNDCSEATKKWFVQHTV